MVVEGYLLVGDVCYAVDLGEVSRVEEDLKMCGVDISSVKGV